MRFPYGHPLFDPEVPDSPAGGDSPDVTQKTEPSGSVSGPGAEVQTAEEKAASGESEQAASAANAELLDRLGKIESNLSANTAVNEALTKHGIGDAAALDKQLELLSRINQNPAMKQVMDSLAVADPAVDPTGGSTDKPAPTDLSKMTAADVTALVNQAVLQNLTQYQQTQNQQQFDNATVAESKLIGEMLKDPAYKSFVKEYDFDALIAGKGGAAGNALAILADQLMYQRGVKDPQTGQMRPVTDATVAAEVGKQLKGMMTELRTAAVLAASQDPNSIENPDALDLGESHFVDEDTPEGDAYSGEPDPKEVREHFRKEQQRTVAVLEGSPAAAILGVG